MSMLSIRFVEIEFLYNPKSSQGTLTHCFCEKKLLFRDSGLYRAVKLDPVICDTLAN